jgi:hypothetical protein
MKTAYLIAAMLSLQTVSGCNKPSDRYQGIEKQPSHPQQQNPGTQPTTPSGGPEAPSAEESDTTAPRQDPDSMGTTRTPASADTPTPGALPTQAPSTAQPMK